MKHDNVFISIYFFQLNTQDISMSIKTEINLTLDFFKCFFTLIDLTVIDYSSRSDMMTPLKYFLFLRNHVIILLACCDSNID